jgi:oxygen-independent coproporphyrinogen-3 oxidase
MLRGDMKPLAEDEEAAYYESAREILESHGYRQYEISNFARGAEYLCRHNLVYWKHQPYMGLGPSAHSFSGNTRFSNKRSLMAYVKSLEQNRLPLDFQEELTPEQLMFEYTFLSLRLRSGVDLSDFRQRFGMDFSEKYHSAIRQLTEDKLIEWDEQNLRLSPKGWMVAESVAAYF